MVQTLPSLQTSDLYIVHTYKRLSWRLVGCILPVAVEPQASSAWFVDAFPTWKLLGLQTVLGRKSPP